VLPEIGIEGQEKLLRGSVLLIGAGGLGSPAALYLAGAGVGTIGIVDEDTVELHNLHRQIIHTEKRAALGMCKSVSAKEALESLNSTIKCIAYAVRLTSANALDIIKLYDVIVDCTDNVPTRYLINDACVLANKPLVSGSAIGLEGQLTVYHYKEDGPCCRCVYPRPPAPELVGNCANNGVLGVVPGIIGMMQALECIKILIGAGSVLYKKYLLFSALSIPQFRYVGLPKRKDECVVCGKNPTIVKLEDYEFLTGCPAHDKIYIKQILSPEEQITVDDYQEIKTSQKEHFLLDVRMEHQYKICSLEPSKNIPLAELEKGTGIEDLRELSKNQPLFIICRRGKDSQAAVKLLTQHGINSKSIEGGLERWAKLIDPEFPTY
jgi:adenylyltransferase/sulfurtransferase